MKHSHVGRAASTAFRGRLCAFVLALITVSLTLPGVAANAVDESNDFVDLPLRGYADMVVDFAHGQVFVSSYSSSQIAVVHLDGSGVDVIPEMFGAVDMSMTRDGRTIYATLRDGDGIAEIDTSTLAARRIPTGAGSCPTQVAAAAGYVWFVARDGGCGTSESIRRLDPATGVVSSDVVSRSLRDPALRLVPGTSRLLVAEAVSTSPWIGVFDVASGSPELVTSTEDGPALDASLRMTTSGQHFFVSNGQVRFYRIGDFSADGVTTAPGTLPPRSAAADDDVLVVGRRDAGVVDVLNRLSGTPANQITLGPADTGHVIGLELIGDSLFVVTQHITEGSNMRLYRIERAAVPGPTLTVEAPAQSEVGRPTAVTGVLSNEGSPIAGAELTVRRYGADQPLGTATTDASGRYSFDVVPQTVGDTIVSVSYPGSDSTKAAGGHATLDVVRRSVSLTLTGPESVFPDEPIALDGALVDGTDAMPGVSVQVQRRCLSRLSGWTPVETVVTDGSGRFTASYPVDRSTSCTSYEYGAFYGGDDLRMHTSAMTTVEVKWVFPTFTWTSPGSVYAGDPVEIVGTLTSPQGPMAGRQVSIRVSNEAEGAEELGTLTTDANGAFTITHVPTLAVSHSYTLTYLGDARTWSAQRVFTVNVYNRASEIYLEGPASGTLDEPMVLRGTLTSRGQAVPGVEIVVSRTDDFRGTELLPTVLTAADGSFVIRDAPPAGGVVSYAASYPGSTGREAASTFWQVDVARPARTLALRANRKIYDQGQIARLAVDLATDSLRTVRVFAQEAGRARTLMFSGEVPETGVVLRHRMTRNTTFTARIAQDGRALGASSTASPTVRPTLTTGALGAYRTARGYKIYRPAADPRFTGTIAPERGSGCIAFQVQRRFPVAWRRVSGTACAEIGDNSTATWRLRGSQETATAYRVRAQFRADDINASGRGPWVYFKFVRPRS